MKQFQLSQTWIFLVKHYHRLRLSLQDRKNLLTLQQNTNLVRQQETKLCAGMHNLYSPPILMEILWTPHLFLGIINQLKLDRMNEPKIEDLATSHDHYCAHSRYLNLQSLDNWQVDNRNYSLT